MKKLCVFSPEAQSQYNHPEAVAYNPKSSYVEGIRPINVKSLVDAQSRGEVTQRISTNIQLIREAIFNLENKIKEEEEKGKKKDLKMEKDGYERRLKREIENLKNERAMLDMELYDTEEYRSLLRDKQTTLRDIIEQQELIKQHKATIKKFPLLKETYKSKITALKQRLEDDVRLLEEIEGAINDLFEDLYQYAIQRRLDQLIEVSSTGGKKTRKRRSTKKRRQTKTSHKKDQTGRKY